MIISKTKNFNQSRGFTIVELLIVIVVIGILAAITIVAYSGITARANTTKAQTNSANAQKVAEAYNADATYYPVSIASFVNGFGTTPSAKLPSAITVVAGQGGSGAAPTGTINITSANGTTTIAYSCLGTSCTGSTGGRITYWDFTTAAQSTNVIYVGSASASSAAFFPAA